jgi:ornithine carbamoyltransferase
MAKRDLLSFTGWTGDEMMGIFRLAAELKSKQKRGIPHKLLGGKGMALVFEKPSLRTRVSFEVGMAQLGGHVVFLGPAEIGLGSRETPADCARNLSRWVDLITVRTFSQKVIEEMAEYSAVPIINALTDLYHPCQVLADCLTLIEHKKKLDGLKIAFVGDGNNMVNSWIEAAEKLPISFRVACPDGYEPTAEIVSRAKKNGADVTVTHSVEQAVRGADAVYTDVWASMGQEMESQRRAKAFRDYQVNRKVVALAKDDAAVMHCLPAHRGEEITDEVLESPRCIAFDQAENRLHVQKAVMVWLLNAADGSKVQEFKDPQAAGAGDSGVQRSHSRANPRRGHAAGRKGK